MIDLNALDDPHLALKAALRFAPYDPFWFEEPVTSDDLDTLAEIRRRTSLRVVSGAVGALDVSNHNVSHVLPQSSSRVRREQSLMDAPETVIVVSRHPR